MIREIISDEAVRYMFQCWVGMVISYLSIHLVIKIKKEDHSLAKYIDWILYYQTTVLLSRIIVIILER